MASLTRLSRRLIGIFNSDQFNTDALLDELNSFIPQDIDDWHKLALADPEKAITRNVLRISDTGLSVDLLVWKPKATLTQTATEQWGAIKILQGSLHAETYVQSSDKKVFELSRSSDLQSRDIFVLDDGPMQVLTKLTNQSAELAFTLRICASAHRENVPAVDAPATAEYMRVFAVRGRIVPEGGNWREIYDSIQGSSDDPDSASAPSARADHNGTGTAHTAARNIAATRRLAEDLLFPMTLSKEKYSEKISAAQFNAEDFLADFRFTQPEDLLEQLRSWSNELQMSICNQYWNKNLEAVALGANLREVGKYIDIFSKHSSNVSDALARARKSLTARYNEANDCNEILKRLQFVLNQSELLLMTDSQLKTLKSLVNDPNCTNELLEEINMQTKDILDRIEISAALATDYLREHAQIADEIAIRHTKSIASDQAVINSE